MKFKKKIVINKCSEMSGIHREFINGVIRKFKPKKILEIGVKKGGGSIVILNAIDDLSEANLYSIDLNTDEEVGEYVNKHFPHLMKKWTLFKGNIATEYMEKIGNNIDMVIIDTAHYEPGEILDFLLVLPFLKENAIAIFHDIGNQITFAIVRGEWASYKIFSVIRGEKFYPSGKNSLKQDIGAIKLDSNQNKYYHDYFRLLGGQWHYFPKETHINQIRNFIKKYYDNVCLNMFEEAVSFNSYFVKKFPMKVLYDYTKD